MIEEDFNALVFVWWALWLQRNIIIFDQVNLNSTQMAHVANCSFREWKNMNNLDLTFDGKTIPKKTNNSTKPNHRCRPWKHPPVGTYKINFDSAKDKFGNATTGCCRPTY